MPDSKTTNLLGWLLSFVLYISVLFVVISLVRDKALNVEKYTASKKNMLNVTLVERKKELIKKKKVVKEKESVVQKEIPKVEKKEVRSVSQEPVKSLKGLFENINLDNLPKETKAQEKKVRKKVVTDKIEEVVETRKASKIIQALKFEEQDNLIITQKDGIYDEFRGTISDILDKNWQETIDTVSGNEAKVIIGVDKLGNFSYTIETLSYNDAFNSKLRDFLEQMKDVAFPPYKAGEIFNMRVVFKDILE